MPDDYRTSSVPLLDLSGYRINQELAWTLLRFVRGSEVEIRYIVATGGGLGLLEIPMKMLAPALCVLNIGTLFALPVHAQSAPVASAKFQIEIQTEGEGAPRYTVTNLTGKTVTACVVRLSSSLERNGQSRTLWDALVQNVPPIQPNASISQFLAHRVGGPLPDKVEVVAGVWVGGETFGDPEWVNVILKSRESLVAAYDQAIELLRQGLDQNWTRDQYLQALNGMPGSIPFYGIRANLTANKNFDDQPQLSHQLVQMMLDSFVEKSSQLKKAKPTPNTVTPG
jgi:hypothetical protein